MLGRASAGDCDHFVGDDDPALEVEGREPTGCCHAMEDGFLLRTLRDVFPFSSGAGAVTVVFAVDLPNPKLDPVAPLGFVSNVGFGPGDGSRIFGLRGSPYWWGLIAGACPLLDSVCPDICDISSSLLSDLLMPGCMYVPWRLLLEGSPGLVGGSNPDLYDAILFS